MLTQPRPIVIPPAQIVKPFEGDCLDRRPVTVRLNRLVSRLSAGGVIGVDGRWGEGKTWLAQHWIASLDVGQPTVYLDAFASDFEDNPFAAVARAMLEAIAKGKIPETLKKQVLDGIVRLGAATAVAAVKVAAAAATGGTSGAVVDALVNGSTEVAKSGIEAAEAAVRSQLAAADEQRKSLAGLRHAIAEFVSKQEGPLVVAIDELDRCRPSYALRLLDVVKHLFDMPGIVFVLFVNREQLEAMVSTQYGVAVGVGYLDKFVHLWLPLVAPRGRQPAEKVQQDHRLLLAFLKRTDLHLGTELADFLADVAAVLSAVGLQARGIERAATLVASVESIDALADSQLAPWLIGLKVAHPNVFRGVVVDDHESHRRAGDIAQSLAHRLSWREYSEFLTQIAAVHRALAVPERTWGGSPGLQSAIGSWDSAAAAIRDIGWCIRAIES